MYIILWEIFFPVIVREIYAYFGIRIKVSTLYFDILCYYICLFILFISVAPPLLGGIVPLRNIIFPVFNSPANEYPAILSRHLGVKQVVAVEVRGYISDGLEMVRLYIEDNNGNSVFDRETASLMCMGPTPLLEHVDTTHIML